MNKRIISLVLSIFFIMVFCLPTFAMADPPETEAVTYDNGQIFQHFGNR